MVKNIRNKLLKTIFIIAILLILIIPKQEIATSKIKLGDINGDSKIDQTDIVLLLRHISATTNKNHEDWLLTGDKLKAADITENNTIDTSDVLALLRYIAANQSTEISKKHPDWLELQKSEQKPKTVEVKNVKLDKTKIELNMSGTKTATIKATVEPANATNKEVTYNSSDAKIATVDKNGKITAQGNGTATITAKAVSNGKKATCKVTVETDATGIDLDKTKATIDIGETKTIFANIAPYNSSEEDVEFINNNQEVVAIEKIITDGTYYIKAAVDEKKVLSIENSSKSNGAKVVLQNNANKENQQFEIVGKGNGYYTIKSKHSGKSIDIQKDGKEKGTKIIQYKATGKNNQLWEFEYAGKDIYYIKSKSSGLYLDIQGGTATNGKQLEIWTENRGKAQKFKLELIKKKSKAIEDGGTYYIKTAVNEGKALTTNSYKIELQDKKEKESQKYEFINIGSGYYIIRVKGTGKVLDVRKATGDSKKDLRAEIIQHKLNGKENQIWKLESAENGYYYIKSKSSGLYLDVQGGTATNGKQLMVWTGNRKDNQKYKLEKAEATTDYEKIGVAIIKAKKDGTATIKAKTSNGKTATCKVTVRAGYWEVKNGKYIYHYLDGTKKEWTVSEYTAWNKLKEQKVKAQDPKAGSRSGLSKGGKITYAGVRSYYRCDWDGPNQDAIKNGGSPYAITVDLDNFRESIFENRDGLWEPIKNTIVNRGAKFSPEVWKKLDHKLYPKNCNTPQGLFYTNGGRYPATSDGCRYWVIFGVKGRINSNLEKEESLYLHAPSSGKAGRYKNTGCITADTEHAKWIYEHCGRGTPVLIW